MKKTIIVLIKNFYFHLFSFIISQFIYKLFILYIDTIYIYSISFMCFIWILNDSFIITYDYNLLENKYNDLSNKYNQLLKDFNDNLKEKYNQTNLICETLAQHTLVIIDIRNEIITIRNRFKNNSPSPYSSSEVSPLLSYDKPIKNAESFNDLHKLNIKMKSRLQEYLNSKSCIF